MAVDFEKTVDDDQDTNASHMAKLIDKLVRISDRGEDASEVDAPEPASAARLKALDLDAQQGLDQNELFGLFQLWPAKDDGPTGTRTYIE